jgi:hypothetical protein
MDISFHPAKVPDAAMIRRRKKEYFRSNCLECFFACAVIRGHVVKTTILDAGHGNNIPAVPFCHFLHLTGNKSI